MLKSHESEHVRKEQTLADAIAVALQLAQENEIPTSPLGTYPIHQLHQLLSDELGLADDHPYRHHQPEQRHHRHRHGRSPAPPVPAAKSWPHELLGPFSRPTRDSRLSPTSRSPKKLVEKIEDTSPFSTPIISSMLASLRGAAPADARPPSVEIERVSCSSSAAKAMRRRPDAWGPAHVVSRV